MPHAHPSSCKHIFYLIIWMHTPENKQSEKPFPKSAISTFLFHMDRSIKKTCTFPTPSFSKPVPGVESSNRTLGSVGRRPVRGAVNGSRSFSTFALLCSSSGGVLFKRKNAGWWFQSTKIEEKHELNNRQSLAEKRGVIVKGTNEKPSH